MAGIKLQFSDRQLQISEGEEKEKTDELKISMLPFPATTRMLAPINIEHLIYLTSV